MKKVLVIDDDRRTLQTLAFRLEAEGHKACLAYNGLGGFSKAVTERPDLIILDVSPASGEEGLKVAERVQTNPVTTGTPIILIGSDRAVPVLLDGRALGVVGTFAKPIPAKELMDSVNSTLVLVDGDRFRA